MANDDLEQVRPHIHQDMVRFALDSLIYDETSKPFDSILALTVIDEFLLENDIPSTEMEREFALSHILLGIIRAKHTFLRHSLDLPALKDDLPLKMLLENVTREVSYGQQDLNSICFLVVRYVYSHFSLDQVALQNLFRASERTLRRYIKRGIEMITRELIMQEWQARIAWRRRLLRQEVPIRSTRLFGRDTPLKALRDIYKSGTGKRILITGEVGIGKTQLAAAFAFECVEDAQLHRIVWINMSKHDKSYTLPRIYDALVPAQSNLTIRDITAVHRVIIIIDQVNFDLDINRLFETCGTADFILLASLAPLDLSLYEIDSHIKLGPLSEEATYNLYRHTCTLDSRSMERPASDVWEMSSGNPLKILAIARDLFISGNVVQVDTANVLSLPDDVQRTLAELILCHESGLARSINNFPSFRLAELSVLGFVSIHNTQVHIAPQIAHTLWDSWQQGHHTRLLQDAAMNLLDRDASDLTDIDKLQLTETIIGSGFSQIDIWPLIERMALVGIDNGHVRFWHQAIENYCEQTGDNNTSPEVLLILGTFRRLLAHHDSAQVALQNGIKLAGANGDFILQQRLLHQLAISLRTSGQYENALRIFDHLSKQTNDVELAMQAKIEMANIFVELKNWEGLTAQLDALAPSEQVDVAILKIELLLIQGETAQALQFGRNLLHRPDIEKRRAQVQNLLGRIQMEKKQYEGAVDSFQAAIAIFERHENSWALGRTLSNCAVCLAMLEDSDAALSMLYQAERQQRLNQDAAGLAATRHNLYELKRRQNFPDDFKYYP